MRWGESACANNRTRLANEGLPATPCAPGDCTGSAAVQPMRCGSYGKLPITMRPRDKNNAPLTCRLSTTHTVHTKCANTTLRLAAQNSWSLGGIAAGYDSPTLLTPRVFGPSIRYWSVSCNRNLSPTYSILFPTSSSPNRCALP